MAISRMNMERQLRAGGGIMTLEEPRQGFFLGKIVKKAKRAVKKIVKSPVGKLGLLAAATIPFGGPMAAASGLFGKAKGLGSLISGLGSKISGMSTLGKLGLIGGASGLAGLMAARGQEEEDDDQSIFDRGEGLDIDRIVRLARMNDPQFRFLPGAEFTGAYAEGGEVDKKMTMIKDMLIRGADDDLIKTMTGASQEEINSVKTAQAEGKAEGGLMDLGGMEMDLRGGGFVPLGAKEKADDVPARLSKNEFVMTADAVRAAGGGSVDKGAKRMYDLMNNLEARV